MGEWLRGRAQAHRRAANTYARTKQTTEAEVSRRVAVELDDLARVLGDYIAAAQR